MEFPNMIWLELNMLWEVKKFPELLDQIALELPNQMNAKLVLCLDIFILQEKLVLLVDLELWPTKLLIKQLMKV